MLVITFLYGYLLDQDNFFFIYAIPSVGLLGILSVFILSTIPHPSENVNKKIKKNKFLGSVSQSVKEMWTVLKTNLAYRHFEVGFMLYGFSFMISVTVITIFFYESLNLNYSSVAFYKNSYNLLAIVLLPFAGKLIGDIDPRKFSIITYSSIAIYILCLVLTEYWPYFFMVYDITIYYTLIFYIIFHGIFAATMVLLWNIGSAYFCHPREAGTYQSIHLSLTGARAIFAPLLGVLFYELFGFKLTFSIAILALLFAIGLMIWSYNNDKIRASRSS